MENGQGGYRHYYQIAGITIQVESDLPIKDTDFHPKFRIFQVDGPGEDTVTINHHFSLPDFDGQDMGKEVYRNPPWAIYRKVDSWIYLVIGPSINGDKQAGRVAIFSNDYTKGDIYNREEEILHRGLLGSLTFFPTDQILVARLLADRAGCYMHSSGVDFEGKGLLFAGHSEAGKSTMAMMMMMRGRTEILCDDRIIIRRWSEGFRIHGTWSHGDISEVSAHSVPLKAVLFLEKADENRLVPIDNRKEAMSRLLGCLIKPFVTADWWEKTLTVLEGIAHEIPCYALRFDKSGGVVKLLESL